MPKIRKLTIVLTLSSAFLLASCTNTRSRNDDLQTKIKDSALIVSGSIFNIKGICWNPVPKGYEHPEGLAFDPQSPSYDLELIERDLAMIKAAGFNTLRPYEAITDPATLKLIEKHKLKVIVPVYNFHEMSDSHIADIVVTLQNHPSTLFWEIGNEWNYNNFYNSDGDFKTSLTRIQEVLTLVRSLDEHSPISVNYGELPSPSTLEALDADIWGLNIYRSDDFEDLFLSWKDLSSKPIYIGEYGADAIDNRNGDGRYAPDSQAYAVETLTNQIVSQYASTGDGQVLGGALFEFSDEWWKDAKGDPTVHDIGGIAPGGGPYPDLEFNEEWWGIVDIDRNPRPAYQAIQRIYSPSN